MKVTRNFEKELEILQYIKAYTTKNKYSPSYREIAKAVNLKSTDSIYRYMHRLMSDGKLTFVHRIPRTIVLKEAM